MRWSGWRGRDGLCVGTDASVTFARRAVGRLVVAGIADGLRVGGNFRCVPGIGPRSENGRAEDWPLVLYTPARPFFYCDGISRLHWDCNRIEDCSRIVRIVEKAFEPDLDGFFQCCDGMKEFADAACLELDCKRIATIASIIWGGRGGQVSQGF